MPLQGILQHMNCRHGEKSLRLNQSKHFIIHWVIQRAARGERMVNWYLTAQQKISQDWEITSSRLKKLSKLKTSASSCGSGQLLWNSASTSWKLKFLNKKIYKKPQLYSALVSVRFFFLQLRQQQVFLCVRCFAHSRSFPLKWPQGDEKRAASALRLICQ